jgi:glycyl-tRNA synthetase
VGTPWCITVDHDTLTERTVTIRERDAMTQVRVGLDQVPAWIAGRLADATG